MSPERKKQKKENNGNEKMEIAKKSTEKATSNNFPMQSFTYDVASTLKRTEFNFAWSERNKYGFDIYLKKELHQFTDSIKARGVIYTLLQLSDEQKCKGVITISSGNFAFILCHYGFKLEIPVTVVMPTSIPTEEVETYRQYLSRIIVKGGNLLEAYHIALNIAIGEGLFYLDWNDNPNMIIGQATLGLEIMEQQSKIDAVILPTLIDGCGLTAAIAIAIKGYNSKIQIIEVQSSNYSFQEMKGKMNLITKLIKPKEYIACPLRNVPYCVIDRFISVTQGLVCSATKYLYKSDSCYDCYGAIALAAILSGQLNDLRGKRIAIPLYGRMESIEEDYIIDRCTFKHILLHQSVLESSDLPLSLDIFENLHYYIAEM